MQRIADEEFPAGNVVRFQRLSARPAVADQIGAQHTRQNAAVERRRQQLPVRHFDENAGRRSLAQLAALVEEQNLVGLSG